MGRDGNQCIDAVGRGDMITRREELKRECAVGRLAKLLTDASDGDKVGGIGEDEGQNLRWEAQKGCACHG